MIQSEDDKRDKLNLRNARKLRNRMFKIWSLEYLEGASDEEALYLRLRHNI